MKKNRLVVLLCLLLAACGPNSNQIDSGEKTLPASVQTPKLAAIDIHNEAPYLPPQCYTKTEDAKGQVHNPCYVCHTESKRPNMMNDQELQLTYGFQDYLTRNQWENLFKDHSRDIAAQTDEEILEYVRKDNYFDDEGGILLKQKLASVPPQWDGNRNGQWDGYIPDLHFNFDSQGFDIRPDGTLSGWRAFAYAPVPGSFWPTNGSMDDVLIRLPFVFRQNDAGKEDRTIYRINLAVVESMIKEQDIDIEGVDERAYGVDLNQDGQLGQTDKVAYQWAPKQQIYMSYVGAAKTAFEQRQLKMAAGLYPLGTEFLHSLRYLNLDSQGQVTMAPRMKELRYARKFTWLTYNDHQVFANGEIKERHDFPDRSRQLLGDIEVGMRNGSGWNYQGFIENGLGELRPQSFEELGSCVACHSTIGAITDSTFAFRRKLESDEFQRGWYHWSQKSLKNLKEPLREDGEPEYAYYLRHNGAGDEFRSNQEIQQLFFTADGQLKADTLAAMNQDVSLLLMPSPQRALALNKAYRVLVMAQSFSKGRQVILGGADNIHQQVEPDQLTGVKEVLSAF